jgi:hypothetical protein
MSEAAEETPQLNPEIEELKKQVQDVEAKVATEVEQHSFTSSELAFLKDQMKFISASQEAVAAELREEKRKREAAEETVELLRGKVEEARRGVMTLQKQEKDRRRQSAIPSGAAEGLGLGALGDTQGSPRIDVGETRALKRQSTIGIGGGAAAAARGHRRISSHSEPGFDTVASLVNAQDTKRAGGLRELKLGGGPSSPTASSHPTFARSLSAQNDTTEETASSPSATAKDTLPTDDETSLLRNSITALERRLADSEEARVASEVCLKALREFIASGTKDPKAIDLNDDPSQDSFKGISLPPLPTDRDAEASMEVKRPKSGWGLRLWKDAPAPSSPALSTAVEAPHSPPEPILDTEKTLPLPPSSTPLASFVASWTKGVSPGSPPVPSPNPGGRSFSFFGKKAGVPEDDDKKEAAEPAEASQDQDDGVKREAEEDVEGAPEVTEDAVVFEHADDKRHSLEPVKETS